MQKIYSQCLKAITLLLIIFSLSNVAFSQTTIPIASGTPLTAQTTDTDNYSFTLCGNFYGGSGREENIYEFVAPSNIDCAQVTVSNLQQTWMGVFVYEGALPTDNSACFASDENPTSTADLSTTFVMTSGQTYYFIVTSDNSLGTTTLTNFTIELKADASPTPSVAMSTQTFNISEGSTLNFFDSGGPNCDYAQDEDFTLTVCPDAAGVAADKIVQLEFTDYNINPDYVGCGTTMQFYKGTAATFGNEIFTQANYVNLNYMEDVRIFTAITAGGCMTVDWHVDNTANCAGEGWEGAFTLVDNPCSSNFSSDYLSAPLLELNETLSSNTECFTNGTATTGCFTGGNNEGWFKVMTEPGATSISIDYEVTGGNSCFTTEAGQTTNDETNASTGLQLAIFDFSGGPLECSSITGSTDAIGGFNVNSNMGSSGTWTITPNIGGATIMGNSTYYVLVDSFSDDDLCGFSVTGGAGLAVLPVELITFSGRMADEVVVLDWSTASEDNNEGFEIQRSTDGVNFYKIGWVNGEGNSNREIAYQYTDEAVKNNTKYYYRLRQIDFDGEFALSDIETVKTAGKESVVSIQPNPVAIGNDIQINITTPDAQDGQILLFDITGKEILNQSFSTIKGVNSVDLALQNVTKGNYFVKVILGMDTHFQKLIVQ